MKLEKYQLKSSVTNQIFYFISEGRKKILKKVEYAQLKNPQDYGLPEDIELYNLGFGDVFFDEENNEEIINDDVRSNNGDKLKVINTVATTTLSFFETHPNAFVILQGNTLSRNREYRIGISKIYQEMSGQGFEIAGLIEENNDYYWEEYTPDRNYLVFLMRKNKY